MRIGIAGDLGGIGPSARVATPALLDLTRSKDGLCRSVAAYSLWTIEKHKKALPTLIDLLNHDDLIVVETTCALLEAIGPEARIATPALDELARNKDRKKSKAAQLAAF